MTSTFQKHDTGVQVMCFVVIVLGKAVYLFSPLPLSESRLAVSLPTLVVLFLRSMRHLCLSCNGLVFAVMQSRISSTLPAHGPGQDLANQTNGLPLFCLLSSKLTKSSSQTLVVMNGLIMGQLLPRQFRKSRTRAQILLQTLRSLHLATSSHL